MLTAQLQMKDISHDPLNLWKLGMYNLAALRALSSNYTFSRLAIVNKTLQCPVTFTASFCGKYSGFLANNFDAK